MPPKADKLLIASGVVLIVGSLIVISAMIGENIAAPNFFTAFGAAIALPLFATLLASQYLSVFRCSTRATKLTALLLIGLGAFCLFGVTANIVEAASRVAKFDRLVAEIIDPLTIMLAVSVFFLVAGWQNWRWYRTLHEAELSGTLPGQRRRVSPRELVLLLSVIAVSFGLTNYWIRSTPAPFGEHVSADSARLDVPVGATDISYCRLSNGTIAYDFFLNEQAFQKWVNSGIGSPEANASATRLREITSPVEVRRFATLMDSSQQSPTVLVSDGLYYYWSKEDRNVEAEFDRTTGRGYYFSSSR